MQLINCSEGTEGPAGTGGYRSTGFRNDCAVEISLYDFKPFYQVYLIKRFLFKPINEMLEKRRAKGTVDSYVHGFFCNEGRVREKYAGCKKQGKRDS